VIQAVEAAFHFGFPTDAGACLIVELDGLEAGLERQAEQARAVCMENGAREVRTAATTAERNALWMARKKAIGAAGRLAPSNCTQDGVIPRTKLPEVLREIAEIGRRYGLRVCNVFHAGDGNLHPVMLFDERDPEEVKRVLAAGSAILDACVKAGGSITGEHGIGLEKIDHMRSIFSDTDLDVMGRIKSVFNPEGLCNPGKIFPTSKGCVEVMLKARSVAL
jgi:glycolate oxidase